MTEYLPVALDYGVFGASNGFPFQIRIGVQPGRWRVVYVAATTRDLSLMWSY